MSAKRARKREPAVAPMTHDQGVDWLRSRYYAGWEIATAQRLARESGRDQAIAFLRAEAIKSWRGVLNDEVRMETRNGTIYLWHRGQEWGVGGEPALVQFKAEAFARLIVDSFSEVRVGDAVQARLF